MAVDRLGTGGMGEVYRAPHRELPHDRNRQAYRPPSSTWVGDVMVVQLTCNEQVPISVAIQQDSLLSILQCGQMRPACSLSSNVLRMGVSRSSTFTLDTNRGRDDRQSLTQSMMIRNGLSSK